MPWTRERPTEPRIERCCDCDDPTGRAGRADDSLYVETEDDVIGPLCAECYRQRVPEPEGE